jgi:hypothetical protein
LFNEMPILHTQLKSLSPITSTMTFLDATMIEKTNSLAAHTCDIAVIPQIIGCMCGTQFFTNPIKFKDIGSAADQLSNYLDRLFKKSLDILPGPLADRLKKGASGAEMPPPASPRAVGPAASPTEGAASASSAASASGSAVEDCPRTPTGGQKRRRASNKGPAPEGESEAESEGGKTPAQNNEIPAPA